MAKARAARASNPEDFGEDIGPIEDALARADSEELWRGARLAIELMGAGVRTDEGDLIVDAALSLVFSLRGLRGRVGHVASVRAARAVLDALDAPKLTPAEADAFAELLAADLPEGPIESAEQRYRIACELHDQMMQTLPAHRVPGLDELLALLLRLGQPRRRRGLTRSGVAAELAGMMRGSSAARVRDAAKKRKRRA